MNTGKPTQESSRSRQLGQVLPLFVFMSVVLLGGAALLTDVAWWWASQQQMQRAADAGALAGAVYLPGNQTLAFSKALSEAAKNGYANGVDGAVVTPKRDPGDPRKLIVDIDSPVSTNFAKVFSMNQVDASVTGAASYVLPVPMGSPQNYYGVGFLVDEVTTTSTSRDDDDTDWNSATGYVGGGQWSQAWNAYSDNNQYTSTSSNGDRQLWRDFRLDNEIPNDASTVIDGLQVQLGDVRAMGSGSGSNCRVDVEVSWDGGSSWSNNLQTDPISTSSSNSNRSVGSSSSTSGWGGHTWVRSDFSDGNFRVRLTWRDGGSGCSSNRSVRVDDLEVRVDYHFDRTTSSTSIEEVDVTSPEGDVLAPQNFWGALQSQGAPNIQGDAYMTYYDTRTSRNNGEYNKDSYYQYGIEFPNGASEGEVWLFDPGFCDVSNTRGTGENWTVGGANGYDHREPISTFYDLYDSRETPYDTSDDILVGSSNNQFRRLSLSDHDLGVTHAADCSDLTWHNGWWRIANDLPGNRTYRLHTYSTDPSSINDQRNSTALNAFAIWAKSNGGTPQVHGLGAMEAYVRLPGGRSSEFYLAQIDREHAGKTMVVRLWDPGDTGNLAASLQILAPNATNYQPTSFSYTAESNSYNAANCDNRSGNNVTSVTTNTGGTSLYNGCWLQIEIALPANYTAPHPSSDSVTDQGGWWKIRYNMSGNSSDHSTDMTTWEVQLRGNPVHLVLQ